MPKALRYHEGTVGASRREPQPQTGMKMLHYSDLTIVDSYDIKNSQDYKCAICGIITKKLVIDHCHQSGYVRGALCNNCNTAIGMFKEDEHTLIAAIGYLRYYSMLIIEANSLTDHDRFSPRNGLG